MTQQMFSNRTGEIRKYDKSIAENNHGWYLILPRWIPYHTLHGNFIGFKVPGGYRHKNGKFVDSYWKL